MTDNLRQQTIKGIGWSGLSQVVTQGITLGISIVLARVLGPQVYGLIGMITVFTGFASVFGDLGLGAAIIQRKELEERHLNTAFWINVVMGCTLTIVMSGLAPYISKFYKEAALLIFTIVIALRYIIDSLCVVQLALLQKDMNFRKLAAIQVGSNIISGCLGLGLAALHMGAWSLVAQNLGASVATLVWSWVSSQWRPRLSFDRKACKELFSFSAYVLAFDVVNYLARNLDQLLIGRFVGPAGLGIYSRAYHFMLMPLNQVARVVGRVMFPALASIQDDRARIKLIYLKSIGYIGLVTFPMMAGLFAVSDYFVLGLLGSQWVELIPIIRIFCWVGMIQSITTTVGWIYQSQGRTRLYFAMGTINSLMILAGFCIGIHWGIMGVAWGYALSNLVLWVPSWAVAGRIIGVSFFEMLIALWPAFLCGIATGGVMMATDHLIPVEWIYWQHLVILIPLGLGAYFAAVIIMRLEELKEVSRSLLERVGGGGELVR